MLKSIPSRKLVPLQELNKDASKKEHLLNQKLDQLSRLVHKLNHMETNNHQTNHHNTTHYHHHNHHNHHNHNSHNTNERQKLLDRIQTLDKEAQQLLNELVSLNHRMNHVNQLQQQQQRQQRQNGSSSDDDDSDDDDASSEKKRLLHDNSSNGSSDEMIELPVHMRDQIHQHGQTMNDMQRELQKWRMSVQRSNMLYSPINNNNNNNNNSNSNNGSGNDGGMSELDRLNRTTADGDAILSIDDSASRLLDQAHEIRGNMSYQRMLISGANAKLGGMRARFPVIDGMIVRIQQKRQRDMVALSFFIAFCVIVTWFLL